MPASDDDITKRLQELLQTVDLETTSERKMREMLEAEFNEDLKERKAIIRQEIVNYLDRQQGEEATDEENGAAEDNEDDNDDESEPAAKSRPKKGRKNHHFGSILSHELQEFLGVESMPRTQVVKAIWAYVKEHNLQDPKNKRKIVCDEKLGKVLPARTDMFKMNKELSKHVFTQDHFPDEEESGEEEPKPKKAAVKKTAAKKPAAKKAATSTKARRKAADEDADDDDDDDDGEEPEEDEKPAKKKRKRAAPKEGSGSLLSPEMQNFLGGVERMGRFQVVKALWVYIKDHNLQDPNDKRKILPDAKLGKILQAPVDQFTLNKQLSKHILKST